MLRVWLAFAAALPLALSSCPSGYSLQYEGICTYLYSNGASVSYTSLHSTAVNYCNSSSQGATPVLIRSQEEQDYWYGVAKTKSYPTALGIRCNTVTYLWEWVDGSKIVYKPPSFDALLSGTCTETPSWYMATTGVWSQSSSTSANNWEIYCMKSLPPIAPPDDECNDFTDDSDDGVCYQLGVHAETWVEAQTVCKSFGANVASVHDAQENSFIRRLAVSQGQVNGVFLGASIIGKDTNFSWIDGSPWDYKNFIPGFPIDGTGDCVAMDTNNVGGQWVNVNCSGKMPFVCAKRPGDQEPSCGDSVRVEGELIYSPGFPSNASVPCDFFLKVDADKLVEVEILFLEANACCDKLILSEGSLGGTVIATLTGEVASSTRYITKSSNIMRASWQPNGGVNVRGMMITFRGV